MENGHRGLFQFLVLKYYTGQQFWDFPRERFTDPRQVVFYCFLTPERFIVFAELECQGGWEGLPKKLKGIYWEG